MFGTISAVVGLGEQLLAVEVVGGALIVISLFALSLTGGTEDEGSVASASCARTGALATAEAAANLEGK